MHKLTLDKLQLRGKRVLIRCDFNCPLDSNFRVTDDRRLQDALPTLIRVIVEGGKLILLSHLGKPKGCYVPEFSLQPIAKRLSELLHKSVELAPDCVGTAVEKMVENMQNGDVILLENTRFHQGEYDADEEFAAKIAKLGDIFVNNAFGVAHRAHASVSVIARCFDKVAAGYLMIKEMQYIGDTMRNPRRPLAAIIGGNKIKSKIDIIKRLIDKADKVFIGGGIANTMLKAQGYEVGDSLFERDKLSVALEIIEKAKKQKVDLFLPVDLLCGREFKNDTERKYFDYDKIEKNWIAMGVGPKTVELYRKELSDCKVVVWNGPMSVFEFPNFSKETFEISRIIADYTQNNGLKSVIGGGDTGAAVKAAGTSDCFSHVSTGGGASLEYMEGKKLPGIYTISNDGIDTSRRFLIAGNWKMNKDNYSAVDFSNKLTSYVINDENVDIMIAPPYTALYPVYDIIKNTHIELGSQNISEYEDGAFTGEISASMLRSCGVRYTIIGHSERRSIFKETNATINLKMTKAIEKGFNPILCVGETLEERENNREKEVVEQQIREALKGIDRTSSLYLIVAYEPVWAIGTGRTASPEQAQDMHKFIRQIISDIYGRDFAKVVRLLYGGSLKPNNAEELLSQPDIDGGLIGGAALKVKDFTDIIKIASQVGV